ncbi:MAG: flagellar biosynthesis protein FlhB [Deltaproteobacteria bacterium]|nr:flagellar biosynthesis protein FlhB [Deltaproteobacteria bacterium]
MEDAGDKTEDATASRLEEARERGDVPQSREFGSFMVFLGFTITAYFFAKFFLSHVLKLFDRYFDFKSMQLETSQDFMVLSAAILKDILVLCSPILIGTVVFGIAASLGQFGFLFTTEKISPSFEKIDPIKGFAKIFSKETVVEFIKSFLKLTLVSFVLYLVLKGEIKHLTQLGIEPMSNIFLYFIQLIMKVIFSILIFLAILGLSDLAYSKWSYAQKMKMSLQEIKDESKQKDGDPFVKSRIRQLQRDRVRKMMMKEVPTADVIVTNPTHVAVALRYQRGVMRAPVVVAKGAGVIAVRIKEIAAKAGVPIVEKKTLARYLYRNIEINEVIPESLYTAVAEVLAYVYKIKKQFTAMIQPQRNVQVLNG